MIDFSSDNLLQSNYVFPAVNNLFYQTQAQGGNEVNSCLNPLKNLFLLESKVLAIEEICNYVKRFNSLILYDELIDPNIIRIINESTSENRSFPHNDFLLLDEIIQQNTTHFTNIIVYTESVFHIDGDSPNLSQLVDFKNKYQIKIIIDESYAVGVFGNLGEGLVIEQNFYQDIDVILYSNLNQKSTTVIDNLGFSKQEMRCETQNNFQLSNTDNQILKERNQAIEKLRLNILYFNQQKKILGLNPVFVRSKSAIQSMILPDESKFLNAVNLFAKHQIKIKTVQFPEVPKHQSRIRISLNSSNTFQEIDQLFQVILQIVYS